MPLALRLAKLSSAFERSVALAELFFSHHSLSMMYQVASSSGKIAIRTLPLVPRSSSPTLVAVDEPLTVFTEPAAPIAPATIEPPAIIPEATAAPVAEGLALRPPSRSVLIRNVAAPASTARTMFSVESLVKVRDALTQALEHARQAEAQAGPLQRSPRTRHRRRESSYKARTTA